MPCSPWGSARENESYARTPKKNIHYPFSNRSPFLCWDVQGPSQEVSPMPAASPQLSWSTVWTDPVLGASHFVCLIFFSFLPNKSYKYKAKNAGGWQSNKPVTWRPLPRAVCSTPCGIQGGAKGGSAVSTQNSKFIFVLFYYLVLFISHCIIFPTSHQKPVLAPPCVTPCGDELNVPIDSLLWSYVLQGWMPSPSHQLHVQCCLWWIYSSFTTWGRSPHKHKEGGMLRGRLLCMTWILTQGSGFRF